MTPEEIAEVWGPISDEQRARLVALLTCTNNTKPAALRLVGASAERPAAKSQMRGDCNAAA